MLSAKQFLIVNVMVKHGRGPIVNVLFNVICERLRPWHAKQFLIDNTLVTTLVNILI